MFFVAMEEEVQFNLKNGPDEKKAGGFKDKLLHKTISNECWSDIINETEYSI